MDLVTGRADWESCLILMGSAEKADLGCRDWRAEDESAEKEQGSSEEAAKVEVAMMQLREQIRKLLDRGYSLPFTGKASYIAALTGLVS